MSDIEIRPYTPGDRTGVRHVCYQTGYMGKPASWMWRDIDSFSDLFSSYYTDHEPESALVATKDGEIVGYLLGCLDTRTVGNPAAIIGHHILHRGICFRPGTAGFIWRSAGDVMVDLARRRLPPAAVVDPRWPAHLHINLLPVARGKGVGGTLMRQWLDCLRERGIAGCHLETLAENTSGVAFFEAMGFRREGGPHLIPGMRTPTGARHHIQLMTQTIQTTQTIQPLTPTG